jgi:hypothetical protein
MTDAVVSRYRNITVLFIEGVDKDTLYRLKKHVDKERLFINREFIPMPYSRIRDQILACPYGSVFVYTNYRRLRNGGMTADVVGEGEGFLLPMELYLSADRIYVSDRKCRGMFRADKHRQNFVGEMVSRRTLIGY